MKTSYSIEYMWRELKDVWFDTYNVYSDRISANSEEEAHSQATELIDRHKENLISLVIIKRERLV